jgi:hypothetical protein
MKKLWILIAALVLFIPLGVWWFSPENVVMRRTKHLMEVVSMSDGAGGPLRQAKVFSMNAMLAPEVELVIPDISDANGTFDKQEMESAFSWICQNAKSSDFRITEFKKIAVQGEKAEVIIEVKGFMELPMGKPADGSFNVNIAWVKGGDGWRFEKIVWKNL